MRIVFALSLVILPGCLIDSNKCGYRVEDFDCDGYSLDQGDCEDQDAAIYPGAEEICADSIDNDCDDTIDFRDDDCRSGDTGDESG